MASIGAALMVAFRAARPEGALRLIDFHTIVLRFAMMQVAAMASTLAGNLTITGSVADLIVVERARGVAEIRFRDYFRVGLPIAALTLLFGWTWLVLVR
jgi:Na+/H+ antiporter NhaD/arsenite permease-like protein